MKCFWSIDESASDLSLPDLCPCSMDVVEDRVLLPMGTMGNPKNDFGTPSEVAVLEPCLGRQEVRCLCRLD